MSPRCKPGRGPVMTPPPPSRSFRRVDSDLDIDDDDIFCLDESAMRHVVKLETDYASARNAAGIVKTEGGGAATATEKQQSNARTKSNASSVPMNSAQKCAPTSDDFGLDSEDVLSEEQLAALEMVDARAKVSAPSPRPWTEAMRNQAGPSARPFKRTPSSSSANKRVQQKKNGGMRAQTVPSSSSKQLTLFGDEVAQERATGLFIQARGVNEPTASQVPSSSRAPHSSRMSQAQRPFLAFLVEGHRFSEASEQRAKTKQWDFAQPVTVKRKRAFSEFELDDDIAAEFFGDSESDQEGNDEFELPPAPVEGVVPQGLTRMKVSCDRQAARTWIYPTNKERRDYQFNIVQRALFNNVLVALPTGLGKTFIAAVVILNYFRWFPEGKIIFVAPTKPLVSQQQVACHGICGLPWEVATEMTGEVKAQQRAEEWKVKRIFYMTPQTFENDLCSDLVNAEDIVCVVVDEAHHATGNYAYGKVIRHLMPRNPFFRVLALTATPGSRPEQVQEVIDSLHINYIEIRSEASLDIRRYVRSKDEDQVVVPLSGIVAELRDKMVQLMRPSLDALVNAGLLRQRNPVLLQPFAVTAIYQDPRRKAIVNAQRLFQHVSDLGALARALEMLIRYSVNMFASRMLALETGSDPAAKGKKATQTRQKNKYSQNTIVREMRKKYEEAQDSEGVVMHPKMDYLQNVIAAHFANEEESGRPASETRVMVFCSFRECVTELVTILNRVKGVSATTFVGQSSDSKGNKGMTQRDQERIVRDFKSGVFNVLVATSIGEEGLDIGEVDLSVNYEAVKNSTRMLQRDGRTGRKRDGRIVTLMSEGLEESNWQHSKDNYKTMQDDIIKGVTLQLFDDVERLVPDDISTEPIFQEVEQPEFEPSMIRRNSKPAKKGPVKKKRDSNPKRNMPDNSFSGFVKVSELRKGKRAKGKKKESIREADDESSSDEEASTSGCKKRPPSMPRAAQSESSEEDNDEALQRGIVVSDFMSTSSAKGHDRETSSPNTTGQRPVGRSLGVGRPRNAYGDAQILGSSSPLPSEKEPLRDKRINSVRFSEHTSPANEPSGKGEARQLATESSSPAILPHRRRVPHPLIAQLEAESAALRDENTPVEVTKAPTEALNHTDGSEHDSPVAKKKGKRRLVRARKLPSSSSPAAGDMGPPARKASKDKQDELAPKITSKRASKISGEASSRRKRMGASPTSRRLFQMEAERSTDEEIHGEGDEHDEGDDRWLEDSSDREHVGDFAPTQAIKGYNQTAVYMQSTHSQFDLTPFSKHAQMLRRPKSRTAVTPSNGPSSRQRRRVNGGASDSSDENSSEQEADEYENDSFICSDNESIAYASQQSVSLLDSSQW